MTKNLYETDKETSGFLVANAIYSPSYLSFDYALAYYGLIPKAVYVYTSATFKKGKKKEYKNLLGIFTYRDVPSQVYPYGIEIIRDGEYSYAIDTAKKALLDKLYTKKTERSKKEMYQLLFEDLRIDQDEFKKLSFNDMSVLCDLYESTNMRILKKVIGDFDENNT